MVIFLIILGLILLTLLFSRMRLSLQFSKQVDELFAQSANISNQIYHEHQLENLPEPVQRYFRYTLQDGQPYISYVRIKHGGHFKTKLDKGWINIKGEQYATTQKPGFIWKGVTSMFVARDMYISDNGNLLVSLFSLFTMVNAKGAQYNQGELLRWLGESVLYPTNLLPSKNLQWLKIDAYSAKLIFTYNELSLFFKITFNDLGQITEMETKRYMDETKQETWVIQPTNCKCLNNVNVPTSYLVLWRLNTGDFSYARFEITDVEYNIPKQY